MVIFFSGSQPLNVDNVLVTYLPQHYLPLASFKQVCPC